MTDHELTITPPDVPGMYHPSFRPPIGRCSCGLFSMIGPEQVIRDFHQAHLQYPDTKLTGKASK